MNKQELALKLIERCLKLGAGDAEAYLLESTSTDIEVLNGQPNSVNRRHRYGYGLRVLVDNRMGFASSNNTELSAADDIIKKLIDNTRQHSIDEHNVFPKPPGTPAGNITEQYDEKLPAIPVSEKIKKAVAIEQAARAADSRIVQIGWLQYGDSVEDYAIASSTGISGTARRSEVYGYVVAVATGKSNGGQPNPAGTQTGTGVDVTPQFDKFDPEHLGRKAAGYAVRMLGAKPGRTTETSAVFPPETGFSFIDLISDMASADLVQKKKSLFAGKVGEMVAAATVTVIDDGRLEGGLASTNVDAEGVSTGKTEIIKNGRLTGLLYDSYSAHRGQGKLTGNASRMSYSARPSIAPTNFYLQPGQISHDSFLAGIDDGIYITEVSGLHAAVDPISGHFSIPSKGILISRGELTQPVSDISISGNIFDFLKNIDGIANDLTWEVRSSVIGLPTFKVKGIKISGK